MTMHCRFVRLSLKKLRRKRDRRVSNTVLVVSRNIATIQPSLQAHLVPLGAQSIIIHAKTLPNPWRQSTFSKSLKFYAGHLRVPRGRLLITAVATVETKYPAQTEHQQSSSLSSSDASKPSDGLNGGSDDGEEVDDRERLRRMRISKANRGNTPWNKGRKHSPETLQKIRERTKIAMQDPKILPLCYSSHEIKMKLSNLGHAQNEETRLKIGEGVRMRWARRKERRKVQETCHFEWQNLLAEAARKGFTDEQEFQWDSYKIMDQQNQLEWLESIEQRKAVRAAKVPDRTGSHNFRGEDGEMDDSSTTVSNISSPVYSSGSVITSWLKGELLGRGSFGPVYEGISG
ncbi:hypothetical protein F2Q69_00047000 [Brassica cretica]|uniref:Nuclease associated modular domain-containing protein n=1 Tax=Brassica cretica TaxID=69181 RepID=A0A8S9Q4X0_BRACR|nr:hypothetical protein F2Q69_00047000 [Brassica cretica]